jgi:hypothetical protein
MFLFLNMWRECYLIPYYPKGFEKSLFFVFIKMFLQPINFFILEILFLFEHPFFYLLFFKNRRQFKNIRINYLTTRDFDTWQQEILILDNKRFWYLTTRDFATLLSKGFDTLLSKGFDTLLTKGFDTLLTKGFATLSSNGFW